ncbi:putative efflux protein, MATE family [Oscillibacter sp. PC13]|uniref:MATE family efflux transporter n=1 Tax=Oscillibacter sp. PC13 TaxID=1855299 RepID=UPI0008EB65FC|nr:MATE family efflux transporter [Oscillibacter sp. PC13]SFP85673.1 putative efflux protein, MATE family [Oscillibacter sp. PC13]
MDFITGDIKQLYRKFLTASMASAMVMSIYSFVDTIAVGQSEGPAGAAAMAVITPLYGVLIFLGILCGVGGSVLYGNARGEGKEEKANALFTAATGLMLFLILLVWIIFALFHQQIFTFFGADAELMPKVMEYARWLIWFLPVFILPTFISSFIRNDGAPGLAMAAVIIGGCVNIFGDWFFVFPLGLGMTGAAIATVLGTSVQVIIMCIHFFTKKCTLRIVKPNHVKPAICQTLGIGFGASILDLGTVILSIIMNNQIMRYGDTNALAVYGVVATITSLFQALYCGVGQAIQPIVSANCGAMQADRIKQVWKMALTTVIVLGIGFTAIGELFPTQIVRLFMDVTPEVLVAAPGIIRPFFLLFLFLGITVLATYHLQSIMHARMSMMVAVLRSVVISGLLIYILPLFVGVWGVWIAMPISELIVAAVALVYIKRT